MAVVVVAVVAGGLEFEGAVVDAEAVEEFLDAVGDGFEVVRAGDDDVAGEGRLGGRDAPDVDMVDVEDTLLGFNFLDNLVDVEPFGDGIGAHAEALGQEVPGGDEDDHGDDEADDGVDERPAGVVDDDAADDDAHGDEGVGQHVEEGPAGVDVVLPLAAEDEGRGAVDDDAHGGGPDDEGAVDLGGVEELLNALDHDGPHGDEEDDGVEQGEEDGSLAVAVGETLGGMRRGQLQRHHSQQQGESVGEVVPRVGEEADGVADEARRRLDDDEEEVEGHGDHIDGREALDGVPVVVVLVVMHISHPRVLRGHSYRIGFPGRWRGWPRSRRASSRHR